MRGSRLTNAFPASWLGGLGFRLFLVRICVRFLLGVDDPDADLILHRLRHRGILQADSEEDLLADLQFSGNRLKIERQTAIMEVGPDTKPSLEGLINQ